MTFPFEACRLAFNGGDFNGGAVESHEQSLGRAAGEFGRELGAGLDRESI